MASVTKSSEEKSMADDEQPDDQQLTKGEKPKGDKPESVSYARKEPGGTGGRGYFTIYKKGQGYWTRIGTVAGRSPVGWILYGVQPLRTHPPDASREA